METPIPRPGERQRDQDDHQPRRRAERGEQDHGDKQRAGAEQRRRPLPRPHRHIAGDRRADGEEERPGHRDEPDLGHAVAVDLLHEEREQEEAAEVGEARERLRPHGEHEVPPAPVRGGDERGGERQLAADEERRPARPPATPHVITAGDVQPTMGPMLSTSMAAVTDPARLQLPTQSMPSHTPDRRRRPAGAVRRCPIVGRHIVAVDVT